MLRPIGGTGKIRVANTDTLILTFSGIMGPRLQSADLFGRLGWTGGGAEGFCMAANIWVIWSNCSSGFWTAAVKAASCEEVTLVGEQ